MTERIYEEVGQRNLEHALENKCQDPDCEIHRPEVIETNQERWTAKAWFYAGACALIDYMAKVEGDEDTPVPTTEQIIEIAMVELQEKFVIHNNWP